MIRNTFFIIITIALAALITLGGLPSRSSAQSASPPLRFNLTDVKALGSNNPPTFMQMSWTLSGLQTGMFVEGFEVTITLKGNGQTGKVVKPLSRTLTAAMIDLQGIPVETRVKMFGGPATVSADVHLLAFITQNGQKSSIGTRTTRSFNPLPNQPAPAPKPTPNPEAIREGLKRKLPAARPTPTPLPRSR
jgi:hypothetical protein